MSLGPLLCIGCGLPAEPTGETPCACPSGLLFRRGDKNGAWRKLSRIDAEIVELRARITLLEAVKVETIRVIAAAVQSTTLDGEV